MSLDNHPTPQERLAISRKAIVRHMQRKERHDHDEEFGEEGHEQLAQDGQDHGSSKLGLLRQALRAWWHHHPANFAIDVARPVVGDYARAHPARLLGIAAAIGAAAVVLKPWRLVSLGGVLLATMKSSNITGLVLSMLSPQQETAHLRKTR